MGVLGKSAEIAAIADPATEPDMASVAMLTTPIFVFAVLIVSITFLKLFYDSSIFICKRFLYIHIKGLICLFHRF